MQKFKTKLSALRPLRPFLLLWSTQALSALGSGMTSFALVIWAYGQSGSALSTALLSICSYAPYVLLSIFAGALSDRWNKKVTMLVCGRYDGRRIPPAAHRPSRRVASVRAQHLERPDEHRAAAGV